METKPRIRVNYLDWLRVLGILLVFLFHTTRLYNFEDWNVKNATWNHSVEYWVSFSTTFMMPLMFVISGASLFYALGKGGVLKFLKDKGLRLLLPMLAAVLIQLPLQSYLWYHTHGELSGGFFQYLPKYYNLDTIDWKGGHLWYLFYLLLFSIVLYPLFRWLRGGGRRVLSWLAGWLSKPGMVYLLALPLWLLSSLPDSFPLMDGNGGWPYLMYFFFLLWGFVIVSDERLQEGIRRLRWVSLWVGLALTVGFTLAYNLMTSPDLLSLRDFVGGITRYFGGWICILAFFGLGMQYLTMRSTRLDYGNEAVLPFYILHQTVILAVGFLVLQWGIPDVLEWLVVVVISFAAIMIIYELLIRRWNVIRFLFGMKPLRPRPAAEAP